MQRGSRHGSSSIGVARVARAAPDGCSLVLGSWVTHVVNGAVYALKYDVLHDFEPACLIATNPLRIVAKKAVPANDLGELIAWLRANSDKPTQETTGAGSALHVAGAFFQEAGICLPCVAYRGGALAMQDLVAGQIDMMIDVAANALPQVSAGSIKAYAVTDKRRMAAAPAIPTVDEAGLPGHARFDWFAIWAPKSTPNGIVRKLNAAVAGALADLSVRRRLADLGLEVMPPEQQTPEALGRYHKAETDR
ncbi:MAG: tripartite tricarboxylate transporter substrate-binding protein [Hyphomicrobiaceae bacterium]